MTEDFGTLDAGMSTAGTTLSATDMANLRTAGKWARFMAIVALVLMAIGVLTMLLFGGTMMAMMGGGMGSEMAGAGIGMGVFAIIYIPILAFSIYVYWKLYVFGSKAMTAVDTNNSAAMSESLSSLGTVFKVTGILTAIFLGFYALALVMGLLGGLASAL